MLKKTLQIYTIFSFCVVRVRSISATSIVPLQCDNEFYKPIQNCVGSFILPNVVLTTSYCAESCHHVENSPIIRSYIHPHYKNFVEGNNFLTRNDVGLVVIPARAKQRKLIKLSALDTESTIGHKALIPILNTNKPRLQITILQRCFKEQPFGYYVCAANHITKRSIQNCRQRQEQGMPLLLEGKIYGITGISSSDSCALPQLSFTAINPALFWISETVRTLGYGDAVINTLHDKRKTAPPTGRPTRPYPSPGYPTGTSPRTRNSYFITGHQSYKYSSYSSFTTSYPEATRPRSRQPYTRSSPVYTTASRQRPYRFFKKITIPTISIQTITHPKYGLKNVYPSPVYPTGTTPRNIYQYNTEKTTRTSKSKTFTHYTYRPSTHPYLSWVYPIGTRPKFIYSYNTKESTTTLKVATYDTSKKYSSTHPSPYDMEERTARSRSTFYTDYTNRPSTRPDTSPVYPTGTSPKWPLVHSTNETNAITLYSTFKPYNTQPHSTHPYPSAVYSAGTAPTRKIRDPDHKKNTITATSPSTYKSEYSQTKKTLPYSSHIYPTGTPTRQPNHNNLKRLLAATSSDVYANHKYSHTYHTTSSINKIQPYSAQKFSPTETTLPTYPFYSSQSIIKLTPTHRTSVVYPTGTNTLRTTSATTTVRWSYTPHTTLTLYPPSKASQSRMGYNYTTLPFPTGTPLGKLFSAFRILRSKRPTTTTARTTTEPRSSPTFLVTRVQSKTMPPSTSKVSYASINLISTYKSPSDNKYRNKSELKFLSNSLKYNSMMSNQKSTKTKNMLSKYMIAMKPRKTTNNVTALSFVSSVTTKRFSPVTLISTSQIGPAEVPEQTNYSVEILDKSKTTNVMDWFNQVLKNKIKHSTQIFYVISSSKITEQPLHTPLNFLDLT
ncbi:hypothetical protein HF086_018027 [Spodoptera exigua]|uniref:Peptidase S1 domain-containing protein n=1 Tax=Spodoptera exigua TaxID=7107 RepID=A0A922S871_SPOEX|nr:hypothetical protein HF086_018027 [Spodoptera exigua]